MDIESRQIKTQKILKYYSFYSICLISVSEREYKQKVRRRYMIKEIFFRRYLYPERYNKGIVLRDSDTSFHVKGFSSFR